MLLNVKNLFLIWFVLNVLKEDNVVHIKQQHHHHYAISLENPYKLPLFQLSVNYYYIVKKYQLFVRNHFNSSCLSKCSNILLCADCLSTGVIRKYIQKTPQVQQL